MEDLRTPKFLQSVLLVLLIVIVFFGGIFYLNRPESNVPSLPNTGMQTAAVDDIVIYASDNPTIVGTRWALTDDATASSGKVLSNPDTGVLKLTTPLANPASYVEYSFNANADVPYHIWLRTKAKDDNYINDSVYLQFSDSLNAAGTADYMIGTDKAIIAFLEEGSGAGIRGWGWNDNSYGTVGTNIKFANSGPHKIRIQQREDGISIDEIVLSPGTFLSLSPGAYKDDQSFVLKYIAPPLPPVPTPTPPTPAPVPTPPTPTPIPTPIPTPPPPGASGVVPELPRVFLNTTYPSLSNSRTIFSVKASCLGVVNCMTSLQTAIDQAAQGDEIVVDAGLVIDGPITLKEKTAGSGWIVIRSANLSSLPVAGNRVSPADAPNMPKIVSTGSNTFAMIAADRAHNYRIVGIEFKEKVPDDDSNVFIQLGPVRSYCATPTDFYKLCTDQSVLNNHPSNIILDRVYVHGDPQHNVKRGIQLDGKSSAVIDSYISDIHVVGQDSQAIAGLHGPGPFKIVNNYLEASTENVLFGGDDPRLENLVPSDIEIKNNYFSKSLTWRIEDPTYAGKHWAVKNIFELKNSKRVLVEGNIFEYSWLDGQVGFAILFTVRNQGGKCPWCEVSDVTFQNNIIRHAGSGISVTGHDNISASKLTQRIKIYNNIWEDINSRWGGGGQWFFTDGGTSEPGPSYVQIVHNTVFQSGSFIVPSSRFPATNSYSTKPNFIITDNIGSHNLYGVLGGGAGIGNNSLNVYFPGVIFTKNILRGGNASLYNSYPGNFFPADWSSVFVNEAAGDYHILASSPYKNAGTDGKDLGADVDVVKAATASVISGITATVTPTPPPTPPCPCSTLTPAFPTTGLVPAQTPMPATAYQSFLIRTFFPFYFILIAFMFWIWADLRKRLGNKIPHETLSN